MFDYKKLEQRYFTDAAFNRATNLFRQLISEYGFTPSEIRESVFLAQYMYEMNEVEQVIRTQEEWEQLENLKSKLQQEFLINFPELMHRIKEEQ